MRLSHSKSNPNVMQVELWALHESLKQNRDLELNVALIGAEQESIKLSLSAGDVFDLFGVRF